MAAGHEDTLKHEAPYLRAEMVGTNILVWDLESAKTLRQKHRLGMTGLGGMRNSKAHVRRKAGTLPLVLTLHESRLGLELGRLQVTGTGHGAGRVLSWQDISSLCPGSDRSEMVYAVYKDLHKHGWYFTDGIRFGVGFLLYGSDPSTAHAPLMVTVARGSDVTTTAAAAPEKAASGGKQGTPHAAGILPLHLAALQRVAHRSAKQVLQAWVRCFPDGTPAAIVYHEIEVTRSYAHARMPDGVEYA